MHRSPSTGIACTGGLGFESGVGDSMTTTWVVLLSHGVSWSVQRQRTKGILVDALDTDIRIRQRLGQ